MGLATGLVIGGLAANAVTQVVGAKMASKASKGAAQDQMRATDQARRVIDETWSPYVNYGRGALSTLGRLTSAPPGARFAASDPTLPPTSNRRPMPAARPRVGRPM
ncbi:MAG: hypothetical protein ACRD15_10015, partial [Vicinamibacterales bacterium]